MRTCKDFIADNPDYNMDITFAVLDDNIMSVGEKVLNR